MKQVTINLYSFDELSKESQQKAIENLSDINTDFDWWQFNYEDAEQIGLKINDFDIDMGTISGQFITSAGEVAECILEQHGETCETYKTAKKYKHSFQLTSDETNEDDLCEAEDDFLNEILKDYLRLLREEYEYQSSEKAIIETIEANDYIFYQDGKLAHCTTYTGKHEKAGITEFHFHGQTYTL